MRQSYFPSTDAGLLAWAQNLSQRLSVDPEAFGVGELVAAQLADLVARYDEAYRLANMPNTRITSRTVQKNESRDALKHAARRIVSIVRGQADVTDAQRIELGMSVPAPRRRAIPRPEHAPTLYVTSVAGRTVHLRLADSQLIAGSAKPPGARAALIFVASGEHPPDGGISAWRFHSSTGRLKCDVTFPPSLAPGTKVWVCAAWVNNRNQPGPACSPVGTHLQFGTHLHFHTSLGLAA